MPDAVAQPGVVGKHAPGGMPELEADRGPLHFTENALARKVGLQAAAELEVTEQELQDDAEGGQACGGACQLRESGLEVIEGVCADACRDLVADFLVWQQKQRPYVILKMAATLDGRIATRRGESQWISSEESRQEEQREQVRQIPIGELFPFKNHPFKVLDDDSMSDTVESVKQYGVLSPLIARPRPKGGYEIISGHRRQHAAELAGLETLPVIVRQMDDDAAIILMVDSNLQREHILPSERAFAYKMKLDAIKNQGARSDLTSPQVASKFRSDDEVAKGQGISGDTVRRFIRLTNLIPELLDMVDNKTVSFNPAVELSYLSPEQQQEVIRAMDDTQNFPSVSQAKRIKKLAQDGTFTTETVVAIMGEEKKSELDTVTIKNDTLRKYFPRSYTPKQMEDTIIKLLEQWQKKRQHSEER